MKMSQRRCVSALLLSCALSFSLQAQASPPRYAVTEIAHPIPGYIWVTPLAINDVGQVLLRFGNGSDRFRYSLYQDGQLHELPGVQDNAYLSTINNAGAMVGTQDRRGFVYQNGTLRYLDSPGQVGYPFWPQDINDAGIIVGSASYGPDTTRAAVYQDGVLRDLGLPDNATANLINNRGDVAGFVTDDTTGGQAFLNSDGRLTYLGTLGYGSWSQDMNEHGTVVGASYTRDNILNAFIYENGVLRGIPSSILYMHSYAVAVNDANQVIGAMNTEPGAITSDPFIWDDGVLYNILDLLDPSFIWRERIAVTDINNAGQIVGAGCLQYECRAFVLTPVPEPTPGWMLASGLALIAAGAVRARRRTYS